MYRERTASVRTEPSSNAMTSQEKTGASVPAPGRSLPYGRWHGASDALNVIDGPSGCERRVHTSVTPDNVGGEPGIVADRSESCGHRAVATGSVFSLPSGKPLPDVGAPHPAVRTAVTVAGVLDRGRHPRTRPGRVHTVEVTKIAATTMCEKSDARYHFSDCARDLSGGIR